MVRVVCVGIAVGDLVFTLGRDLGLGGKNFASSMLATSGGPAANAAKAIVDLGGSASLVAHVGDDRIGDTVLQDLRSRGIDVENVERIRHATSSVSVALIHPDGERTIVNSTDPRLLLEIDTDIERLVSDSDIVLTDARWSAGARRVAAAAAESDVPLVVDFDATHGKAPPDPVYQGTHLVFSSGGLRSISRAQSAPEALLAAADATGATVGVTLGDSGSLWVVDGAIVEVPAYRIDVVSTLGAGDVFHGAFALGIGEGRSIVEAARWASAAAATFCALPPDGDRVLIREDVRRLEASQ
jgi:sulfofructose kinase